MRDLSLISRNAITREYIESKLDVKKYNHNSKNDTSYRACNDICYIDFDNSFIKKGTKEYKNFCINLAGLIGEDEENDWSKIQLPFESFYNVLDIEYHYQLDILKDFLYPFIEEEFYVITDCCDIVPIKEFILYYSKLD